ncbi:MAG: DUF1015 domain-containing protein [Chloroflexi bacterium]|nr:MAG: DUF1015 domain-containing protein [Chloroflexota bacterium]
MTTVAATSAPPKPSTAGAKTARFCETRRPHSISTISSSSARASPIAADCSSPACDSNPGTGVSSSPTNRRSARPRKTACASSAHYRQIEPLLDGSASGPPVADFTSDDGQTHTLRRIDDPSTLEAVGSALEPETLYVADGHHRYETALAYRDERRAAASAWRGDEPENFVLVALASAADPGLLVLPIHRVTAAGVPLSEALNRLTGLFAVEKQPSLEALEARLSAVRGTPVLGLASAESADFYLLSVSDGKAVDGLLPQARSHAWRNLDYAIANHVILQHILGVEESQMSDYGTLWFTEDAAEAVRDVRSGPARYALLLNPVPITRVLDVADAGERMPQKSTFFYPKVPTGLVFNPLEN